METKDLLQTVMGINDAYRAALEEGKKIGLREGAEKSRCLLVALRNISQYPERAKEVADAAIARAEAK